MATRLDRLLAQLNQTQLAQKDNPTYQVIKGLIDELKKVENSVGIIEEGNTNNVNNTTIIQQLILSGDGGGEEGGIIPGPVGLTGATGATGAAGPATLGPMGIEPDPPEDPIVVPGPIGETGATGATGPQGPPFPAFIMQDGNDGEDGIPGPPGVNGTNGVGGGWTFIDSDTANGTTDHYDYTNLSSYGEILIIFDGITKSASQLLVLVVSTDNGSTFLTSSGDYVSIATTGAETNDTGIILHTTAATAARSGFATINPFNSSSSPKSVRNTSGTPNYFVATSTALNAIRIFTGSGTLNAGTIYIYGR